ncbi:MAG: hypothetical protein Kow0029_15950 [Candidatus Rifleibacteriota bacterium]
MNNIYDRMKLALNIIIGNKGDGWFVIMEEPDSEKFVQFAFDEDSGLYFDCPIMAFSDDELRAAHRVMKRFGVSFDDPKADQDFSSINTDVGFDAELGAQIASAFFREVFLFSDNVSFNIEISR